MKKLVFGLIATIAFSFSGFAANDVVVKEIKTEAQVEYKTTEDCCVMVRFCWKEGSKTVCGDWQEMTVPCDKGVVTEFQVCEDVQ